MPGQGVTSMFNFGQTFGWAQGVLEAMGISYELVQPQKWKKEFSITGDKNSSIMVCKRLFPGVSLLPAERCRKDNDGMAEALLMAEYAKRRL
nr:MAG TPA: HOLLIDAY JUNCTION RESOLVASE [Caudoviricetes sp.]